jgi:lantibiotic biosynthesis protein
MLSISHHCWQAHCQLEVAEAARLTAKKVAERLRDENCVQTAGRTTAQQSQFTQRARFLAANTFDLAGGYTGVALLSAYLDSCFAEEGWDIVGHAYLRAAMSALEKSAYYRPTLFSGLSGAAFATLALSREGKRYQRMLATLEERLFPDIMDVATEVITSQTSGYATRIYDTVSGLSGMGAYLLCRREHPDGVEALRATLTALVSLSEEQDGIPRWYTPPQLANDSLKTMDLGHGYVNFGLAHGIAGPLALLSLAKSHGIEVPGQSEAIARIANRLIEHHLEDEWGINWPKCWVLGATHAPRAGTRTAWCYGTPGIARALWLAGSALACTRYQEIAVAAMQSVYRQPLSARRIDSPTFCHGVAGLLHITLRFAHDTANPLFFEAATILTKQLLGFYQPTSLLGYRHEEASGAFVDSPWLLDGAAGVVLVLLAASSASDPFWDRMFLLS